MKTLNTTSALADRDPATGKPSIDQAGITTGPAKLALLRKALALRGTPALYSQDGQANAATVFVKLFDPCGSYTLFVTEFDGNDTVFGFVTGMQCDELGYASLSEISNTRGARGIGMEIDTHFLPQSLGHAKGGN